MTNQYAERLKKWQQIDSTITSRIENLLQEFKKTYPRANTSNGLILVCAPGRAEILGSHTDYNGGLTISTNIGNNLLFLARPRNDKKGRVFSLSQGNAIHYFTFSSLKDIERKKSFHDYEIWTNYIKGVVWSLMKQGYEFNGFDVVIESSIPVGAGVSSSAAIALATAHFLKEAYNLSIERESLIDICKTAENKYVGAPCGYLDQGTIELADSSWLLMDYRKQERMPFVWKQVAMNLGRAGGTFIIGYDPNSKHSLVEGKYALRKSACELTLLPLSQILGRTISALGEVSVAEFAQNKKKLEKDIEALLRGSTTDRVLRFRFHAYWERASTKKIAQRVIQWIEHVIKEDERVDDAMSALKSKDIINFGQLLTESGKSAIFNYELNENADELSWVYKSVLKHAKKWGVFGIRNMGGGFNATTLALVSTDCIEVYKAELQKLYMEEFNSAYHFLEFIPSPAVGRIELTHL